MDCSPDLTNKVILVTGASRGIGNAVARAAAGAGAEIIASGNVFIYGALFGKAIAGADGDTRAEIFCYQLSPELISIGGIYIVSEDIGSDYLNKSVRARLLDEKITLSAFAMNQNSKHYI